MKAVVAMVPVLLAAAAFVACGANPVEQNGDPQLTLSADSVTVRIGASALVAATLRNTSEPAQFVSRDQGVAIVDANGAISGIAVGSTYVVATLSSHADVRDSVRVRVQPPDTCLVARPDFGGPATAADRALFAYDASEPLNLQKTVDSTTAGVEVSSISYSSPDGGWVPGILVEPVGRSGLRPGMVILHPSGMRAKDLTPYAQMLAQHGAVVIAIDAPYFRRIGPALQFSTQDRAEQIQLIKDLQRAVDVLLARGNVDPARIGFEGYSYGGIIGAQFVGIERRLKAAVLAAAHGGQVTGATTPANLTFLANQLSCATRNAWFRDMTPIEPIRYIPNASPTALFFQIGRFDTAVLPGDAQALYNAASSPKEVVYYDTGHGLNAQALLDRHDWLHQQIGIDPR
ncbi:MAG TPA: prolyl oligopeptidase family serine peptidase [Longimicrobium sp.]|nr:prolyl oligopeptidase family serine peptidase [Longimicrobium sp.]